MKKFFFFLSAIALLGLTAACNEEMPVNPNFNAERGDVKTSFIINVATTSQTKATANEVQATTSNPFRGMESINLLMTKGYGTAYLRDYVYNLGDLTPIYDEAPLTDEGSITADNSRRVYNLTIPTGVENMTFYAKAKDAGANSATAASNSNNKVKFTVTADRTTTNFQLVPIVTQEDAVFDSPSATKLLAILNAFSDVVDDWKALNNVELLTACNNYYTTDNETLRQGSGPAVLRTMQDLYNLVSKYPAAADESKQTPEQKVCAAIKAAIERNFNVEGQKPYTLTYKDNDLLQFPFEQYGLPVGAAQIKCTTPEQGAPTFAWVNPSNIMDANTVDYMNIMYPAEICYWADSPLRISNTEGAEDNPSYYPTNWSKWNDDAQWSTALGWLDYTIADNRVVTKETRAVALHNNVLYGNALVKATVKMEKKQYEDNAKAVAQYETDQTIEIDGVNNYFTVTGILIGGQPKQVEWNFVADQQADRTGVIYDHTFDNNNLKVSTEASEPFYTMVFDNYVETADAQEKVYFALELENHVGEFYGKDNLVYEGGKFYLVGTMELTSDQINKLKSNSDYSSLSEMGYRIPPVNDKGEMVLTPRVFMQDFTTTMNITLGPNALKTAYSTIPDLRPTQMYFGLSVDLTWKTGASFDIKIGE